MTLLILFVILAIGVSFLCSLLEAALLSMTPSYVETLEDENPSLAESLRGLREDIDRPLAAILSLNTIAHTVGATGAGAQAAVVFGDAGVGIFSAVLTLGILVLSEIVPKTIGATYWRALSGFVVRVLPILITVQLPLVWMSQWLTRLLTRGGKSEGVTREEIAALTTAGTRLGVVDEDESRIVSNLFSLDQVSVEDVMTPRIMVDALPETMTVGEVVASRETFPFSRLPLHGDTLDDVRGFVLVRDILLSAARDNTDTPLSELMRDLPRVADTTDVDALLTILFEGDHHLALVEDPFGGTAGIVSLEDVIETLLGQEIVDEHDAIADLQALARKRASERRAKVEARMREVGARSDEAKTDPAT